MTSLRDFFVTLFLRRRRHDDPIPTADVLGFAAILVVFTVLSRALTVIPSLYLLRQGWRASMLPAINLAQLSRVLARAAADRRRGRPCRRGGQDRDLRRLVILAALSTFAMGRSDALVRGAVAGLKRLGARDLDGETPLEVATSGHGARIMILGFFRTASSLVAELEARQSTFLGDVAVVDFNPVVHRGLTERGIRVAYGDISQPETLIHAGVRNAEVLICTVPDFLLKGITNERLVRQLRSLNPTAKILAPAELLSDVDALYQAGADYVTVARLTEAAHLYEILEAIEDDLLESKRDVLTSSLDGRSEVLA